MTREGLAWSRRRNAFTSEEHRGCTEGDVVAVDTTARGHPPHAGEGHVARKLPQQPSRPAAHRLPHHTGPPGRGQGAVSTSQRRSD